MIVNTNTCGDSISRSNLLIGLITQALPGHIARMMISQPNQRIAVSGGLCIWQNRTI